MAGVGNFSRPAQVWENQYKEVQGTWEPPNLPYEIEGTT